MATQCRLCLTFGTFVIIDLNLLVGLLLSVNSNYHPLFVEVLVQGLAAHSHSVALTSSKVAAVTRSGKVGVLVSLGAFLAATHLTLIERVARSDGVLVGRHRHSHFTFFK